MITAYMVEVSFFPYLALLRVCSYLARLGKLPFVISILSKLINSGFVGLSPP